MWSKSFLLFFICNITFILASLCLDRPDPLRLDYLERVSCPMVKENKTYSNSRRNTNMFNLTFTCGITDISLCEKVKNAFESAEQILSDAIMFNQFVNINATFTNICVAYGACTSISSGIETQVIGGAGPSRVMMLKDDDGVYRFYPQSLVKQLGNKVHPKYSDYDINAIFNSEGVSYWFKGDGNIKSDQIDLEMVILHELVHGLGFLTSLNDYMHDIPQGLTPYVVGIINNSGSNYHFIEATFDKYMSVVPTGQNVSDIIKQMDVFNNIQYSNQDNFTTTFLSSPQYNLATDLFSKATKSNSLTILSGDDTIFLETSLTPFNSKSSISHFSSKKYTNTSDFLMRFSIERGKTLQQYVKMGGNYANGPIGPKLRAFLKSLGYTILDSTSNAQTSISTTISIIELIIWCMLTISLTNIITSCFIEIDIFLYEKNNAFKILKLGSHLIGYSA
ncbi:sequence orphan [Gigaspora margarita]|uniref:Sequence orphan n=1 Tax=Gigaspora margarita TaxID=4874 RepID=A0A8H4AV89_GIGMA|nr:sequence orphan [Gigaspora margarita]